MKHFLPYLFIFCFLSSTKATTFTVLNANASGPSSLVEAIDAANLNPGHDTIHFDIPGMPPHVIPLAVTASITISDSVSIDGTSQPDNGYLGACPKIVIDAAAVDPSVSSLIIITAPEVSIYGIWFKNYTIVNSVVLFIDGPNAKIGANGKKNIFSNVYYSIAILDNGLQINSNYFGCNCDGTVLEANANDAISAFTTINNLTISDNLISGNLTGIRVGNTGFVSNAVVIKGNKIGTDISGMFALGNTGSGMHLTNLSNLELGGAGANEGNVVSGNGREGCTVVACSGTVFGNKIGTDITGNDTLPNDPLNTQYNTAFNCNGYSGLTCSLNIGGMGPGEQNIFFGNDIALNIADSSGHYVVSNNVIGQTLSGLVSPFQHAGFQLYYDTNQVVVHDNYIFGSDVAFYAAQCRRFLSTDNIIGLDVLGNSLSMTNGFSLNTVDSFTILNNSIQHCVQGIIMLDCNESYTGQNSITNCATPIVMRVNNTTCHHNQLQQNFISFNTYTVDLRTGTTVAANDDLLPPVIEGSTADSTWGSSLPGSVIDLCRDTTLDPLYPQGYQYNISPIYADGGGHWVYSGNLINPNDYTAVQTDLNNNSSGFSSRLTVGITKTAMNPIRVYPTPAADYIILENLSGTDWKQWQLSNSLGAVIAEGTITDLSRQQIDVQKFAPGIYFVKVFSERESYLLKFVKR